MSKKAQVTFFISWVILAIVITLIAALIIPFGTLFTIEAYKGGEMVWNITEPRITAIQDTNVRNAITTAVTEAKAATQTSIEMETDIYQYSWVIMLVVLALVAFLFTRKNVETGGGVI